MKTSSAVGECALCFLGVRFTTTTGLRIVRLNQHNQSAPRHAPSLPGNTHGGLFKLPGVFEIGEAHLTQGQGLLG